MKIVNIKEVYGLKKGYAFYDGYVVETETHKYHVLIGNGQCCCENWGYLTNDDDLSYFIGKEIREVRLTDVSLNQTKLDDEVPYGFDCGEVQFIDFVTDERVFQIGVYNAHNGYYGHSILITKDDEILIDEII